MNFFASRQDLQKLDKYAVQAGIEVKQMMELAGYHMIEVFEELLIKKDRRVLVFIGKGNKGGDGLCAVRHLINNGWQCAVCLSGTELSEDAEHHMKILKDMKVNVFAYHENVEFKKYLKLCDVVIDALIGYNLDGAPRGVYSRIINKINNSGKIVIAYDIPTGMDATTGECFDPTINAYCTLTLGLPKKAFKNDGSRDKAGKIYLADIGIPNFVYEKVKKDSKPSFTSGITELS